MNRLLINKKGNILLITLMILTSVLVITLGVANLIIPNIAMNRTQSYSLKAYFASETGAEKSLWSLRKGGLNCATNNQCIDFSQNTCVGCLDLAAKNSLNNGSSYSVEYASSTLVTLKSWGSYMGARRTLEIEVGAPIASSTPPCQPSCVGKTCGDDGCGGVCSPGCSGGQVCSSGICSATLDNFAYIFTASWMYYGGGGVTTCPSGYSGYNMYSVFGMYQDPGTISCFSRFLKTENSFGGMFTVVDPNTCSINNPFTGACSCPTGFSSFPALGAYPGDPFVASTFYCMKTDPTVVLNSRFGGGFYRYDYSWEEERIEYGSEGEYLYSWWERLYGNSCWIANPLTNACSCPGGFTDFIGSPPQLDNNNQYYWHYCLKDLW